MTSFHKSYVGLCPTCGKHCYLTKQDAKAIRRRMPHDEHLSVYRCGQYWHLGNLPKPVISGRIDRSKILPPRRRTR
ncbi:hypothetical protein [Aeromicrobium sp. 9AM]|uniref:hypothetical protein n=1 Tax=Aeromicrobium sp. 9AM TaxID=2653126 RepID=UPI0012F17698|nr:hypothetical protein [Aeromicrobium sp. 9AM]VXB82499.1 conserved hypothetical protein [Aeromicrobium sp. 9AM]